MAKRTWLWVVLGLVAFLMVGCFAVVGTGIYVFSRHVQVNSTNATSAEREFQAIRDRFKGESPLVTRTADGETTSVALEKRAAEYSGPLPKALHLMAYDAEQRKLVHFQLPFWLVRMGGAKSDLRAGNLRLEDLRLDPNDLERAGPALILDEQRHGGRVLLWTE